MWSTTACIIVCVLCFVCSASEVEYERSGSCTITQECVYKYTTTQYSFGENEREEITFSADVHWRCESSGLFGAQPASEFCLTLSNANVTASVDLDANHTVNYATSDEQSGDRIAAFTAKKLQGEFCYVQTQDGKIATIHFSPTDSHDGINVKRGIASAFQANFDHQEEVEESDPGSQHISHYKYSETDQGSELSFTRIITRNDLMDIGGGAPEDSLDYTKEENSTFINKVLERSHGTMRVRINFGHDQNSETPDDGTFNPKFDFGKEFEVNGTYAIEKMYCKQRSKRSITFADLSEPNVQKGTIRAVTDLATIDKQRIRKMRDAFPSITGFLEELRQNPNNTQLVHAFQHLLALEAKYGAPPQHTAAIEQIFEYYKKVQSSNKPEDVFIRTILYSFFSADSSPASQMILGSVLSKTLGEEERNVLLHQITLINNASADLVDTIINLDPSNEDNILLVLGALARNNDVTIQTVIVRELLNRLNTVKFSANGTDNIATLTYALGNTGSKQALDSLLLSLGHYDNDIQISAIRSLGVHLDQPSVQQSIINLLASTEEDKIFEEVLMALVDAFDSKVLTSPTEELINTTVNCAIRLDNPNLYELLIAYLQKIDAESVDSYVSILVQQHNYGDVKRDTVSSMFTSEHDSRIKRGSDWDEWNSDYDVVASYSQRRNDVTTYPYHRAYIWGRKLGVDKLNLQVGAGAFIGAYCTSSTQKRLKAFAKGAAKVQVFGRTYSIAHLEYSDHTSGNYLYHRVYVRLGSRTYANVNRRYDLGTCRQQSYPLWSTGQYTVFNLRFNIFVFVGTIGVYIRGSVGSRGDASICVCPSTVRACADVKPSLILRVAGGAQASLLYLVRGGIEVSATVSYYIQPSMCVQGLHGSNCGVKTCLRLYHGWPTSYIDIFPWYQSRTIRRWRITWGDVHRWNALSRRWDISGSRNLLWSSCPTYIAPCK